MIPSVSPLSLAVLRRHLDVFRHSFFITAIPSFVEPLVWLVGLGFGLGMLMKPAMAGTEGFTYLEYIAPGIAAGAMMSGAALECAIGSFVRVRFQKLYDAMMSTPCSLEDIVTGDILYGVFKALFQATAIFIVMAVLGLIKSPLVLLVPVFAVAAGFLFGAIGLCYCAVIPEITWVDYFFALFVSPMFILSGAFFPLSQFPPWLQSFAAWLPLYHTVVPVRALTLGTADAHILINLLYTLLAGLFFYLLSIRLMRRRLIA